MKEIKNFINGEYVASGRTFDKHSPLTGEVIAKVHEASRDQVNAAVAAARAQQKETDKASRISAAYPDGRPTKRDRRDLDKVKRSWE